MGRRDLPIFDGVGLREIPPPRLWREVGERPGRPEPETEPPERDCRLAGRERDCLLDGREAREEDLSGAAEGLVRPAAAAAAEEVGVGRMKGLGL
jgi:hypothetical protein